MKTLLTRSATLVLIGLCVWPAFIVVALPYSYLQGEGSVLNTWYLEPKRNLLAHFLDGLVHSAPIALGIAVLALTCGLADRRFRWVRLLPLLLIPAIGIAIALLLFPSNTAMLICLSLAGLLVAVTSLVLTLFMRILNR